MHEIKHRLIRTYEVGEEQGASSAALRIEVWKDLEARTFWARVYRLEAGQWKEVSGGGGSGETYKDEQAVLDAVLQKLS